MSPSGYFRESRATVARRLRCLAQADRWCYIQNRLGEVESLLPAIGLITLVGMLPAPVRFKLHFGPYRTPRLKRGAIVEDEIHGTVTIIGLSDGRIPWPIGRKGVHRVYVVFGALARAVRRESAQAVCHWFGVSRPWVVKCRRALDVPINNEGTRLLRVCYADTPTFRRITREAKRRSLRPEARAKNAAAHRGVKRPAGVVRKMAEALRGRARTAAHRRNLSESLRRSFARSPWMDNAWTESEDEFVKSLPVKDAAARTGRTVKAIYHRRNLLGLSNKTRGRTRQGKMSLSHKNQWLRSPFAHRRWTARDDEWLRTLRPAEVAEKTGRTLNAVWARRRNLGLPDGRAGRIMPMSVPGRWTPEEDAAVRQLTPLQAVERLGRTLRAVSARRRRLGVPDGRVNNGRRPAKMLRGGQN